MVVWVSGDGGWGKMEREVTRRLAALGVPTMGVDSLRYFIWRRGTRDAASEIASRADAQMMSWGRSRLAIVGFSFGADIGPFLVRDLPPATRARVAAAAFVSPSAKASMQVSPASWLGLGFGPPVWPTITALAPTPVLCIGGAGVFADICPAAASAPNMTSVRLDGGHLLKNQYATIAGLILRTANGA